MRSLEFRGLRLEFGGLALSECKTLVSNTCALAVYKLRAGMGIDKWFVNKPAVNHPHYVDNHGDNTPFYTQSTSFLYTAFGQKNPIFVSVINVFVHIFHSAYIKDNFLKKGNLLIY